MWPARTVVSSNVVANAPGTQRHSPLEVLEVEQLQELLDFGTARQLMHTRLMTVLIVQKNSLSHAVMLPETFLETFNTRTGLTLVRARISLVPFLAVFCIVCDKKLGRSLGTRLALNDIQGCRYCTNAPL